MIWQPVPTENRRGEYDREMQRYFPNVLTFEEFCVKLDEGKTIEVGNNFYSGMTRISTVKGVIELIKNYASYPVYRNENTIKALYERITKGYPTDMPIFVKKNGSIRIIAGNTRCNLAYIAGVKVTGHLIDLDV